MIPKQLLSAVLAIGAGAASTATDTHAPVDAHQAAQAVVSGAGQRIAGTLPLLTNISQAAKEDNQTTGGGSGEQGALRGRQGRRHSPQAPQTEGNDRPKGEPSETAR